jgi:hypothetical protein
VSPEYSEVHWQLNLNLSGLAKRLNRLRDNADITMGDDPGDFPEFEGNSSKSIESTIPGPEFIPDPSNNTPNRRDGRPRRPDEQYQGRISPS